MKNQIVGVKCNVLIDNCHHRTFNIFVPYDYDKLDTIVFSAVKVELMILNLEGHNFKLLSYETNCSLSREIDKELLHEDEDTY